MDNTIETLRENPNFNRTRLWAKKRGIIIKNNEETQVFKLIEEFGELCGGVLKQDRDLIVDSVGDMIVVLTNLNKIKGFDLEYGLEYCYKEIYEVKEFENIKNCLKTLNACINDLLQDCDRVLPVINYSNKIINLLILICVHEDMSINECFNFAYNEIKNRTGKNVDGNFIKD
jgi:NTP pyrophosphatase (non-canonical NTP hydrolase)